MSYSVILETSGIDALIAATPGRVTDLLDRAGFAVEGRAKALAPIKTGYLANSIQAETAGFFTRHVNVGADYGIYQEFGTYKMAAHPFLSPAVEWARPTIESEWKELFRT